MFVNKGVILNTEFEWSVCCLPQSCLHSHTLQVGHTSSGWFRCSHITRIPCVWQLATLASQRRRVLLWNYWLVQHKRGCLCKWENVCSSGRLQATALGQQPGCTWITCLNCRQSCHKGYGNIMRKRHGKCFTFSSVAKATFISLDYFLWLFELNSYTLNLLVIFFFCFLQRHLTRKVSSQLVIHLLPVITVRCTSS